MEDRTAAVAAEGPAESMNPKENEAAETAEEKEIRAWAEEYSRKNGWVLNPDAKVLATVIRGLARNEMKLGARYCPCRIRSGDPEKDKALVCPCVYHQGEVEKEGHCHCNLFFRKDTGKPATEVPD